MEATRVDPRVAPNPWARRAHAAAPGPGGGAHRAAGAAGPAPRAGSGAGTPAGELWCRVVEHPDGYLLQFGGEPAARAACLEALKGAIPARRRRWDPASETWWIDPVMERMFPVLSRWVDRWFAPGQVHRSSAPERTAAVWGWRTDTGDEVTVPPAPQAAGAAGAPAGPRGSGAPAAAGPQGSGAPAAGARSTVDTWHPPASPDAGRDALAAAYAALWLRPGAPAHVVKAAYRALAALHHPDVGGDEAAMRRLNAAYAVLEAAGGVAA